MNAEFSTQNSESGMRFPYPKAIGRRAFVIAFSIFNFQLSTVFAQENFKGQVPHEKTYRLKDIYDSTYGIEMYDKYNPNLGGDSIRKNLRGYALSGWVHDYYTNGSLLHAGFYADGQTSIFTNYYPNGQEEREFKIISDRKSEMKKYYEDGKMRSQVEYFNGNAISYHDFYENGQPLYVEEYDKKHEKLLQRCSYYPSGKPQLLFQPENDKKSGGHYSHKEYYPGGQLKEEYGMIYNSDALDYIKDGEDKQYDDKGALTSDVFYVNGQETKVIK